MDEERDNPVRDRRVQDRLAALWRALRPALPATIGAAALTFLFVAVMPLAWVATIGWQLYLDRLSDLFVPPVGNGGRLALAVGMAAIAALLAGFVALLLAKPASGAPGAFRRRRADMHPDDTLRPPIRAGRDLPEGGLGPLVPPVADQDVLDLDPAAPDKDELVLADLAPVDYDENGEGAPWLQPAELAGPASPGPADNSLGAMVERFEAGLARRRLTAAAAPHVPVATDADAAPEVDFALEAALGTLSRMNRSAVG
ncbi:MAG TPA: hypothetical protein PKD48_17685 [Sphingopyxis sp.]|nr:hypothetical protein [Sphingopyxis sp.]